MRVIVLNQYYAPDVAATGQLLSDLCIKLSHKITAIDVVCAPPNYNDTFIKYERNEKVGNLRIFRVGPEKYKGRKSLKVRLYGYFGYLWFSLLTSMELSRKSNYSCIMTVSNPPIIGFIGAFLSKVRKIPFIYILHDIHPDIVVASGKYHLPKIVIMLWNFMNKIIFNRAVGIVVLSETMKNTLIKTKGVNSEKVKVIPNWAHPELDIETVPSNEYKKILGVDDSAILVVYSGNMGISHNLEILIDAACYLREENVHFVFVGSGEKKTLLMELAVKNQLANVSFLDYLPENGYAALLRDADICVVAQEFGFEGYAVPSKFYVSLSMGKPILGIMSKKSELSNIINTNNCGWVVQTCSETVDILRNVAVNRNNLREMGAKSSRLYIDTFSLENASEKYYQLLLETVECRNI